MDKFWSNQEVYYDFKCEITGTGNRSVCQNWLEFCCTKCSTKTLHSLRLLHRYDTIRYEVTYFFSHTPVCLFTFDCKQKFQLSLAIIITWQGDLLGNRNGYIEHRVCRWHLGYEENNCYCSWESDHSWWTCCRIWQSMCNEIVVIRRRRDDVRVQAYEERLRILNLPTLKFRRITGDMIEVFKIITGKYDSLISPHCLFHLVL